MGRGLLLTLIAVAFTAEKLAAQPSTPVGAIAGEIGVSPTGAAAYRIPIHIPQGISGMQPAIALEYSSQAGNGILGVGWGIAGLSAISRTPKTIFHDTEPGAIDLLPSDRFALDGNRLTLLSGVYGGNGAVYTTENELFAKIFSEGTSGSGPAHFTVFTKDGRTLRYGSSAGSRVEVTPVPASYGRRRPGGGADGTALHWRLSEAVDANGNKVEYTYSKEAGETTIQQIVYTGNGTMEGSNSIRFSYAPRNDNSTAYLGGGFLKQSVVLSTIKVLTEGVLVREYRFSYSYFDNGLAHLTEIAEIGGDGLPLRSTVIGWTDAGEKRFAEPASWIWGFGSGSSGGSWSVDGHPRQMADVNGDGLPDIVGFADNGVHIALSNGRDGFTYSGQAVLYDFGTSSWSAKAYLRTVADVDGDGRADMVGFGDDGVYVALSTGSGFRRKTRWVQGFGTGSGGGSWSVGAHPRQMADVNGDGLPDIVGFADNGVHIALSNGRDGFTYSGRAALYDFGTSSWSPEAYPRMAVDVNGDGRADIVGFGDDGVYVALSTGNGFKPKTRWVQGFGAGSGWSVKGHPRQMADVNGDGLPDIVGFASSGVFVGLSNHGGLQRVASITDGFGQTTRIAYETLSRPTEANGQPFYTRASGATYPVRDVQPPIACVESIAVPNGVGGVSTTRYTYEGARVHLAGKGFLGFTKQTATCPENNRRVTTETELDYSLCRPLRQTQRVETLTGRTLSSAESTFTNAGMPKSTFSYISKTVSTDIGGITATTTYTYHNDSYGNIYRVATATPGGYYRETRYESYTYAGAWIPSKPTLVTTTQKHPDDPLPFSNATRYTFDPKGNLLSETANHLTGKQVTTTYSQHNPWGMPTRIATAAGDYSVEKSIEYDAKGRYVKSVSDESGTVRYGYDPATLNRVSETSVAGLTTRFSYDAWGRLLETRHPDH